MNIINLPIPELLAYIEHCTEPSILARVPDHEIAHFREAGYRVIDKGNDVYEIGLDMRDWAAIVN